jgi:SpoVK/Ycf46/Vps4 family AAA+-type ATPase
MLRLEDTPASGAELDRFLALWTRESTLLPAMLLLQWGGDAPTAAARKLAERLPAPIAIASREPVLVHRAAVRLEINKVEPMAQRALWREALGENAVELDPLLTKIAGQFRMSTETIASLSESVMPSPQQDAEAAGRNLWRACRGIARPMLDLLAERIDPRASWSDLVLPAAQTAALKQIAAQSRHRMLVNEQWGFAERGRRGLGLSALFAGPTGTGKTLAAEVLARELDLDLYRIDLSAVVSKYIGETEKNLRRVFDAAETGGVLLLFDEADALFGKRSEVKDSHDRYANIEVGYLLQRMESFQGIAVLTSNMKNTLDKSFQRRIRFVVDFPFPDAVQRAEIWAQAFPSATPTEKLDAAKLARLSMAGGNIRNIALNAAFSAANAESPVRMEHVLAAARAEAAKVERPLLESEIRGWV